MQGDDNLGAGNQGLQEGNDINAEVDKVMEVNDIRLDFGDQSGDGWFDGCNIDTFKIEVFALSAKNVFATMFVY